MEGRGCPRCWTGTPRALATCWISRPWEAWEAWEGFFGVLYTYTLHTDFSLSSFPSVSHNRVRVGVEKRLPKLPKSWFWGSVGMSGSPVGFLLPLRLSSAYRMCRTFFSGSFPVARKPSGVPAGHRMPPADPVGKQSAPRLSAR
jgi:hypothetical protein